MYEWTYVYTILVPNLQTSANSGSGIHCDHLCISFKSTHSYCIIVTCLRRCISSLSYYSKHLVADPQLLICTNWSVLAWSLTANETTTAVKVAAVAAVCLIFCYSFNEIIFSSNQKKNTQRERGRIWKINHSHTRAHTHSHTDTKYTLNEIQTDTEKW